MVWPQDIRELRAIALWVSTRATAGSDPAVASAAVLSRQSGSMSSSCISASFVRLPPALRALPARVLCAGVTMGVEAVGDVS